MQKIVLAIICFVLLAVMFPLILSSTHTIQTEETTDAALALTGTPPAGAVTLTEDLWQGDKQNVISVTGDKPETLAVVSYVSASKTLNVTGVTTSTTATVVYEVEGLKAFTGLGAMVGISPLLIWIGAFFAIILGLFFAFKGKFTGD